MAKIKPFRALRPKSSLAKQVAELPYDVLTLEEVLEFAGDNPLSFFHITRPEMDLDSSADPYSREVYLRGRENLKRFMKEGVLQQDEKNCYYLYTQVMDGRSQTGIVALVSIDDYFDNVIKKHELTREDKENDRTRHLEILNANTGPVFMTYRDSDEKGVLIEEALNSEVIFDFIAEDGIRHQGRRIGDAPLIEKITAMLADDDLYIADGHHRAASAARVGQLCREGQGEFSGEEEFNSFLTVIFPHDQLTILPYNRVVTDLNGKTPQELLEILGESFSIVEPGQEVPGEVHNFSMYLEGVWYTLRPKFEIPADPVESLDVNILQHRILKPMLGIDDPRKSDRIDFVGGIRGTKELEKLVDSGRNAIAFSLYPTGVEQLIDVSDSGKIMPPKSTWFEPKLRSGLFVHLLDE